MSNQPYSEWSEEALIALAHSNMNYLERSDVLALVVELANRLRSCRRARDGNKRTTD